MRAEVRLMRDLIMPHHILKNPAPRLPVAHGPRHALSAHDDGNLEVGSGMHELLEEFDEDPSTVSTKRPSSPVFPTSPFPLQASNRLAAWGRAQAAGVRIK